MIQEFIDQEINPVLDLHKGSCQVISQEGEVLTIAMQGGCAGCPSAKMTLFNFVAPTIMERFPNIKEVVLG